MLGLYYQLSRTGMQNPCRFPLVVAGLLTTFMYIWNWGQRLKSVSNANRHIQAEHFFAEGDYLLRTPAPTCFLRLPIS